MDTDVAAQLQALLDGPYADVRQQTRRLLIDLGLEKAGGLDRDTYRDLVRFQPGMGRPQGDRD